VKHLVEKVRRGKIPLVGIGILTLGNLQLNGKTRSKEEKFP
jgi:hypothetical protein